jgi:hypothetical protein
LALQSCSNNCKSDIKHTDSDSIVIDDKTKILSYVPLELIGKGDYQELDTFSIQWYSYPLSNSDEPVIYNRSGENIEIYRFVIDPSFLYPKIFRIENDGKKTILISKTFTHPYDSLYTFYDKTIRVFCDTVILSDQAWQDFQDIIDRIDFWKYQTNISTNTFDGVSYFIEGCCREDYRFIEMHNPEKQNEKDVQLFTEYFLKNGQLMEFEIQSYFNIMDSAINRYLISERIESSDSIYRAYVNISSSLDFFKFYHGFDKAINSFSKWGEKYHRVITDRFLLAFNNKMTLQDNVTFNEKILEILKQYKEVMVEVNKALESNKK